MEKNTGKVREFCQSGKVGTMVWNPSLNPSPNPNPSIEISHYNSDTKSHTAH